MLISVIYFSVIISDS